MTNKQPSNSMLFFAQSGEEIDSIIENNSPYAFNGSEFDEE